MKNLLLLFVLLLTSGNLKADEFRQELLSRSISVSFSPEKAFFIVKYQDNTVKRYQTLLIPPVKKSETDPSVTEWLIGTYVKSLPENSPVSYNVFIIGKQNEAILLPAEYMENSSSQAFSNSKDLIRQQINVRKKILDSLMVQNKAQSANLKRLRSDAEVIANLSRIVDLVEEIEVVTSEIENLDKDLELLRSTFQAVKSMPQPKNYLRRELELTKQSDEFLKLVKSTESDEDSRKEVSQAEIQRKLNLIEETRYEDEEKLKQQLVRLKTGKTNSTDVNTGIKQDEVKNYWEIQ